jgi:hypothetical protein
MSAGSDDDAGFLGSIPFWTSESILNTLDIAFRNTLTPMSTLAPQPPHIKLPLRNHQKALIYSMCEREKESMSGIPYKNTMTYANYGVLGDEVGTGKSLVVLGYISHLKHTQFNQRRSVLFPNSSTNFFTVYKKEYKDASGTNLIIVPHTIYRQWQEYCKKHTDLNIFCIKSAKEMAPAYNFEDISGRNMFIEKILTSDAVLVSNTLYGELGHFARAHMINWKRIFIDEVDSIHIPSTSPQPTSPFTWFITATWPNFIMEGHVLRPPILEYYQNHVDLYTPELGTWLRAELGISQFTGYGQGRSAYMRCRSSRWLVQYRSEHRLRAMVLLMCTKEFLDTSRQMPLCIDSTILCEQPASHKALNGLVSAQVQNMLHAGNVEGALMELGISADTPMNLAEAATLERMKELDRLKKTLAFKETIDYATPQAKENAVTVLKNKIHSVEEQLKTFRERLENIKSEECPICYDDPTKNSATLTPCCHRVFCAQCILTSLTRGMTCPLCRAAVKTNELVQLVEPSAQKKKKVKSTDDTILSKPRALLKFLKENPQARILVFSRYENPFSSLERDCEMEGITYHTLRGNKDTIAATIRAFEKGEKRVLFLPTESVGAGLNLVTATHVVLLHAMTQEEEKQAVGRAFRLGRTENLNVIRLLHAGESVGV